MTIKAFPLALATVLAVPMVIAHAGGWAVTTVENVPQHFVAGTPTTLTFSVRQHGIRLVAGLHGSISATLRNKQIDANATPTQNAGYYAATLTLPEPGEWTITINSGFGPSRLTLLPIQAVAASAAPAAIPAVQRGEQLFVAKGCNTCHYHGSLKRPSTAPQAADLTDKRYSDALLAKILQDPSIVQPTGIWTMPNLNLSSQEIAALVAFINKPKVRS